MSQAYPGDSPGKRLARRWAYDQVPNLITRQHIVIPSEHGGDIDELYYRGVHPRQIRAADISYAAANKAEARGCEGWHGTIQSLIRWMFPAYGVASINIDLCNTVHKAVDVLNEVLFTTRAHKWQGIVMLTFARGYKDGRGWTDADRINHLNQNVLRSNLGGVFYAETLYNYQSKTETSHGTPMSLVVMRVDGGVVLPVKVPPR